MNILRFSWWAIASVVLQVPWISAFMWVLHVYATAKGKAVAGEVWLLPGMVYAVTAIPGAMFGVVGVVFVRTSQGQLRGQWLGFIGIFLAILFPVSGPFWKELTDFVQRN